MFSHYQTDQILVLSLNDPTANDLRDFSNAGLLERMEWYVPQDVGNGSALSSIRLRLDSRGAIYQFENSLVPFVALYNTF